LDGWTYCTLYIHTVRDYGQYSAIAILHTFQFTFYTHLYSQPLLVVSWQRNSTQPHCHFKSHRLIPFVAISAAANSNTRLDYPRLLFYTPSRLLTVPFHNSSARTPRKTQSSIVNNACLLIRYLAMNILLLSRALVLRECVCRPVA
jgi:hypothetical protein